MLKPECFWINRDILLNSLQGRGQGETRQKSLVQPENIHRHVVKGGVRTIKTTAYTYYFMHSSNQTVAIFLVILYDNNLYEFVCMAVTYMSLKRKILLSES